MSKVTTYMGPLFSLTTTNANTTTPHLYLDSSTTLETGGGLNIFGSGGQSFKGLMKSQVSINPGAVSAQESATTDATINAVEADDVVFSITPESAWSGTYHQVNVTARVSAASTVEFALSNVSGADITPDELTWDVYWLDIS